MSENTEQSRIKNMIADINYEQTLQFFNKRVRKYKADNPYSVTMYQDNNPALVSERNKAEVSKLLPFLKISPNSKILDLACGIGRWSDAIHTDVDEYCGIDFSEELIKIARKRHPDGKRNFYVGAVNNLQSVLAENKRGKYNTILLIGILMYINDKDFISTLNQVAEVSEEHCIICIREPVGINERLTLKNFFSSELEDTYNAIYRTRDELMTVFEKTLLINGFRISHEGFMFSEDALNNRKETAQYYYIFER